MMPATLLSFSEVRPCSRGSQVRLPCGQLVYRAREYLLTRTRAKSASVRHWRDTRRNRGDALLHGGTGCLISQTPGPDSSSRVFKKVQDLIGQHPQDQTHKQPSHHPHPKARQHTCLSDS